MIGATWLGGHTEEGERFALLTFEAPSQIRFGGRRLTLERAQLEKYRLDVLTDTGPLPFEHVTAVTAGEDPPDFVVATPSGDEGIECASLTLEKRRRGYGLFDHFRARLLVAAQSEPFPHLADCVITLWFAQGASLPPKTHDQATVDRLVEMLREARIDRAAVAALSARIAREGFPESLAGEPMPIFSAGEAGGANITPVEPGSLQGPFAQATGFRARCSSKTSFRLVRCKPTTFAS